MQKRILVGGAIAAALVISGTSGAVAGGLITSAKIQNDSVRSVDIKDKTLKIRDMRPAAVARLKGKHGLSAYDLWKLAGNTGTVQDFLVSLIGQDGLDGLDGLDGKDGANGTNGADGKDGANGVDGTNGADGKDGANGVDGTNGADGKDGANGVDGTNGADGKDGANGVDGKDGQAGLQGQSAYEIWIAIEGNEGLTVQDFIASLVGLSGKDGAPGEDGKDGAPGKDGLDGQDGANGVDGKDGLDGQDGSPGAQGAPGTDGAQGPAGKIATVTQVSSQAKGTASVTCPAGTMLVGGGAEATGNTYLRVSMPTASGWTATLSDPQNNLKVYALCATA